MCNCGADCKCKKTDYTAFITSMACLVFESMALGEKEGMTVLPIDFTGVRKELMRVAKKMGADDDYAKLLAAEIIRKVIS